MDGSNDARRSLITLTMSLLLVAALIAFAIVAKGSLASREVQLPLIAILSVMVLVFALASVSASFSLLGLSDPTQALGLPDGSIRSVIALSLVMLFAVLPLFLYRGIAEGSTARIEHLTTVQRDDFLKSHPNLTDLDVVIRAPDRSSPPATGPTDQLYDISYRVQNAAADDFAKQLLVLLGSAMTSITAFYLGAKTATSSAASALAATSSTAPPAITSVSPTTHYFDGDGPVLKLTVSGSNLNNVTQVRIERSGQQLTATSVTSNPTQVVADVPVSAQVATGTGPWDVVVQDAAGNPARLSAVLTIAPGPKPAAGSVPISSINYIDPTQHSLANDGPLALIRAVGTNLSTVSAAYLQRSGNRIYATKVTPNPNQVVLEFPVDLTVTPVGIPWDLVLTTQAGAQIALSSALTIS